MIILWRGRGLAYNRERDVACHTCLEDLLKIGVWHEASEKPRGKIQGMHWEKFGL